MRKRINRALFATAAAGVSITTLGFIAMSASASAAPRYFNPSGGTPIGADATCNSGDTITTSDLTTQGDAAVDTVGQSGDCAQAGYVASGRDFRFSQALINVPDATGNVDSSPTLYVGLDSSTAINYNYARVGIMPCSASLPAGHTCSGSTSDWEVFMSVMDPALSSPITVVDSIPAVDEGDGILCNVYFNAQGNADNFTVTLPSGTTYTDSIAVTGPLYNRAEALADWATADVNNEPTQEPAVPSAKTRDAQFFQGRFTTSSGSMGTFSGPWTLNGVEATSNGDLPSTGTLIGQPSYLWNDGSGFGGKGDDAFGVWRFPF